MCGAVPPLPNTLSWRGSQLKKLFPLGLYLVRKRIKGGLKSLVSARPVRFLDPVAKAEYLLNARWTCSAVPRILTSDYPVVLLWVVKMIVHKQLESEPRTARLIGSVFMLSELLEGRSVPVRLLCAQIPLWGRWGIPVNSCLFSATVVQVERGFKSGRTYLTDICLRKFAL
jgi:hypothetical protein